MRKRKVCVRDEEGRRKGCVCGRDEGKMRREEKEDGRKGRMRLGRKRRRREEEGIKKWMRW